MTIEREQLEADVLIIGAGPGGLSSELSSRPNEVSGGISVRIINRVALFQDAQ